MQVIYLFIEAATWPMLPLSVVPSVRYTEAEVLDNKWEVLHHSVMAEKSLLLVGDMNPSAHTLMALP